MINNIKINNLFGSSFFKYVLSGLVSFIFEYLVFILLNIILDFNIIFSTSVSFIFGLSTSFILNKFWAFKVKHNNKYFSQIIIYVLLAIINIFIVNILVLCLVKMGLLPYIAKIISMVIMVFWNYLIYKNFIFK